MEPLRQPGGQACVHASPVRPRRHGLPVPALSAARCAQLSVGFSQPWLAQEGKPASTPRLVGHAGMDCLSLLYQRQGVFHSRMAGNDLSQQCEEPRWRPHTASPVWPRRHGEAIFKRCVSQLSATDHQLDSIEHKSGKLRSCGCCTAQLHSPAASPGRQACVHASPARPCRCGLPVCALSAIRCICCF